MRVGFKFLRIQAFSKLLSACPTSATWYLYTSDEQRQQLDFNAYYSRIWWSGCIDASSLSTTYKLHYTPHITSTWSYSRVT